MKNFSIILSVILLFTMLLTFVGCDEGGDDSSPVKLSFSAALSYDYLKSLDGKSVTINGYMATSSPVDGSFMFLMNLPFQSCPFCVPNTSTLSNTMEVYPKKGDSFTDYVSQAIKVTGKLEVAKDKNKPFIDSFGYDFVFKIVDAEYTILKSEELSGNAALWQKLTESGAVNDVNSMFDYLSFVCRWNTYSVKTHTTADGTVIKGYYLYAADALNYLGSDTQYGYKYGTEPDYFDNLIKALRAVDPSAFEDLCKTIGKAKTLAEKALKELKDGNYTSEKKYFEEFDNTDYYYTLNKGEELTEEYNNLYTEFSLWLGNWEI